MKCREFEKYLKEYGPEMVPGGDADLHKRACSTCAELASGLAAASMLVKSLAKAATPPGFDERLKARIAARKATEQDNGLLSRLGRLGSALAPVVTRRYALAPILAAIAMFAILLGTGIFPAIHRNNVSTGDGIDWSYIRTCKEAHASILSDDPFADNSAALLKSRNPATGQVL